MGSADGQRPSADDCLWIVKHQIFSYIVTDQLGDCQSGFGEHGPTMPGIVGVAGDHVHSILPEQPLGYRLRFGSPESGNRIGSQLYENACIDQV